MEKQLVIIAGVILAVLVISQSMPWGMAGGVEHMHDHMDMDDRTTHYLTLMEEMKDDMRHDGQYRCCLEDSCTYCIEKTPGHGVGPTCDCLSDIMNGEHPCGECIGEILEGHGNPLLAEYFARAIAEEVGEEHLETMQKIIEQKYGIPIAQQIV